VSFLQAQASNEDFSGHEGATFSAFSCTHDSRDSLVSILNFDGYLKSFIQSSSMAGGESLVSTSCIVRCEQQKHAIILFTGVSLV